MNNRLAITLLGLACCLAGSAFGQGMVYVNGTTGSDAWDGRCEAWDGGTCGPKARIQAGINAAVAGEQVVIANGVYTGYGNRDLYFGGKAITVRSAGGPDNCTIDLTSSFDYFGLYFSQGEGPTTIVDGITITSAHGIACSNVVCWNSSPTLINCVVRNSHPEHGSGLSCTNSATTLINCRIISNGPSDGSGGGAYLSNSSPTFIKCTIAGNHSPDVGNGAGILCMNSSNATLNDCLIAGNGCQGVQCGGVYCDSTSTATLTNCSISRNHAPVGEGTGVWVNGGSATLHSCSVWGNDRGAFGGTGTVTVDHSDVQGGWAGTGNIDADPLFVDAAGGDYHLSGSSPCIDAGDPAFDGAGQEDFYGLARMWDGDDDGTARVDMGISEFGSFQYGDMNCDGALNAFDIDPFVLALTDPAGYAAAFPGCSAALADANGDGAVNAFDIDPFVALLTGGGF